MKIHYAKKDIKDTEKHMDCKIIEKYLESSFIEQNVMKNTNTKYKTKHVERLNKKSTHYNIVQAMVTLFWMESK